MGIARVRSELMRLAYLAAKVLATELPGEALATFNDLYVSLAKLARERHLSPEALLLQLPARPVCGPGIRNVQQYFCLRSDLAGF